MCQSSTGMSHSASTGVPHVRLRHRALELDLPRQRCDVPASAPARPPAACDFTNRQLFGGGRRPGPRILLYKIPRVVIGKNRTFYGGEDLLRARGVDVVVLDDPECIALMEDFIAREPGLWNED